MRDTLAAASDIAFPPKALCYVCSRLPDEYLEFSACVGSAGCSRTTSSLDE
jgi:hypothetical protein